MSEENKTGAAVLVKHEEQRINENFDALVAAIKFKYPLMLINEIPSELRGWMDFWAKHPDFSVDKAESQVLDLEEYYIAICQIPAPPAPSKYQPPDIQGMLEVRSEGNRAQRIRNISLGVRLSDMNEGEEALWREGEEIRRQEKENQEREYQEEKLNRLLPATTQVQVKNTTSLTSAQQWLLQIPEQIRTDYAQWCFKNNLQRTSKNWVLYVEAKKAESPDWIDPTQNSLAKEGHETSNEYGQVPSVDDNGGSTILDETDPTHARDVNEDADEPNAPNFTDENGRTKRYARREIREAQGKFRAAVLNNWHGACAITGQRLVVEACHLVAHADGGAASVENGIALAVDLHRLLDSGHLQIANGRVLMSDEARLIPRYQQLHGQELRTPIQKVMFA